VPHLEALLLLRGIRSTGPSRSWPVGCTSIPTPPPRWCRTWPTPGLATCTAEGCRYAPADAATAATVDEVAVLYARRTVAIAELIHSTSDRKAQRFADAFRLRKEP
jgi:hypothetical protein